MCLYDNASKLRTRKMDWMRHPEWRWFVPFVDFDYDLTPKYTLACLAMTKVKGQWANMAMGYNQTTSGINGPN